MQAVLADLKSWWAKPFSVDMPATGWFALVGFLMLAWLMWAIIVGHILKGLPSADIK